MQLDQIVEEDFLIDNFQQVIMDEQHNQSAAPASESFIHHQLKNKSCKAFRESEFMADTKKGKGKIGEIKNARKGRLEEEPSKLTTYSISVGTIQKWKPPYLKLPLTSKVPFNFSKPMRVSSQLELLFNTYKADQRELTQILKGSKNPPSKPKGMAYYGGFLPQRTPKQAITIFIDSLFSCFQPCTVDINSSSPTAQRTFGLGFNSYSRTLSH